MAFLVDDLLLSPAKLVHFLARSVHEAARKELYDEDGLRRELRELYLALDTGEITEEEFEEREWEIVARLEAAG